MVSAYLESSHPMKIIALDVGDVWTGIAISDALGIVARPLTTVESLHLNQFLTDLFAKESIETVVVGHPITLRGTKSEQTTKIEATSEQLKKQFPAVTWVLWDERLTSKQAQALKSPKSKDEKKQSHAIAAAFILSSYLEFKRLQAAD